MGVNADFQAARSSAALRAELSGDFATTLARIGPGGTWRDAIAAVASLHRRVKRDYELVHCWDLLSLSAAALAGADRVLYSPSVLPGRRAFRALRAAMLFRHLGVVCPVRQWAPAFAANGVDPTYLTVIPPSIEQSTAARSNAALRARLGFRDADRVVLAPGESTRAAGHDIALWAISILHVLDPHIKMLVWGRGPRVAALSQLAHRLRQPTVLTIAEKKLGRAVEFEDVTGACDAAVISPRGSSAMLPIRCCVAAGLPLVVTPTAPDAEHFGPAATITQRPTPRLIAQRLLATLANPTPTPLQDGAAPPLSLDRSAFLNSHAQAYRYFAGKA